MDNGDWGHRVRHKYNLASTKLNSEPHRHEDYNNQCLYKCGHKLHKLEHFLLICI